MTEMDWFVALDKDDSPDALLAYADWLEERGQDCSSEAARWAASCRFTARDGKTEVVFPDHCPKGLQLTLLRQVSPHRYPFGPLDRLHLIVDGTFVRARLVQAVASAVALWRSGLLE